MRDSDEPGQPALAGEDAEDDAFTSAPLDPFDARTRSLPKVFRGRRARFAGLGATALLVVVVVVSLFVHVTSDPSAAAATLLQLPSPAPTATFPPGANVVYFSAGAPWGTLTVDGKRLSQGDLTGDDVSVTRGPHHLVYQARYFPSLRCVFSAPRVKSDTCPLDTSDLTRQFLLDKGLAQAIDLGSTGATLEADQRVALTQLVNTLLASQSLTTTIEPGERYLDDHGRIVTATAPLAFTLTLSLDSSGTPNSGGGTLCYQFCPYPAFSPDAAPGGGWTMLVSITSAWAITDASGRRLTSASYQAGQQYPDSNQADIDLQLTPDGWSITGLQNMTGPAVDDAAEQPLGQAVSDFQDNLGVTFNLAPNPLNGCVMDASFGDSKARVFWRFGVLLAVDASARRIFTHFPVATAEEQAQVARIMAQQPTLRDDSILPTG